MNLSRSLLAFACLLMVGTAMADFAATSSRAVDLSGHWKLNVALSEDAEAALQRRLDEERRKREAFMRRAQREGMLFPPPDPDDDSTGATPPQEQRANPQFPPRRSSLRQRREDELRKMLGISNTLDIVQSGGKITMESQVDARRFDAGSHSQVSMPQGELADSNVGWDGEWFVIERRVREGPRVTEKYRLLKTDQLESTMAWSGDTVLAGIKVRRIYDRVTGVIPPPDPAQGPVR